MLTQILQIRRLPNQPIDLQINPQLRALRSRRPRPRNPQPTILLLGRKVHTRQLLLYAPKHLDSARVLYFLGLLLLGFGAGEGAAAVARAVHVGPAGFGDRAVCCGGGDAARGAGGAAAGFDAGDEAVAALGLEGWFGWGFAVEAPREEWVVDELNSMLA